MMLHLEYGNCDSRVDSNFINQEAFSFDWRGEFVLNDPFFDFQCPACGKAFRWMSGLLQHMENYGPCREDQLGWEILLDFLTHLRDRV